jgi:hypothetical protein
MVTHAARKQNAAQTKDTAAWGKGSPSGIPLLHTEPRILNVMPFGIFAADPRAVAYREIKNIEI